MQIQIEVLAILFSTAVVNLAEGGGSEDGLMLSTVAANNSDAHRLYYDLFLTYNKHVRPTPKWGMYQTDVFFEISLFDILSLDLKSQQLRTNTEMIMKWLDSGLKWNPGNYSDIKSLRVPWTNIWVPDILLKNVAMSGYVKAIINTNVIIFFDGEVELMSHAIFTSLCNLNTEFYPFDQQYCALVFHSWTYNYKQISMLAGPADLSRFNENPEYFLEDFFYMKKKVHSPCCIEPFSSITYEIQLQRRTIFSLFFFIMPGILINVCAILVFSLPAETNEKVMLGISSMLAMMVFLMAMTEKLPPTETLPLAGVYYGVCIMMISFNVSCSVFVLNLNWAGRRAYDVPDKVRHFVWWWAKKMRVRVPMTIRLAWRLDEEGEIDELLQDLDSLEVFDDSDDDNDEEDNLTKIDIGNKTSMQMFNDSKPQLKTRHPAFETVMEDPFERRFLAAFEAFGKAIKRRAANRSGVPKGKLNVSLYLPYQDVVIEEWKFISRVMDRFLCIIFVGITGYINYNMLTVSPYGQHFEYCPLGKEKKCEGFSRSEVIALTDTLRSHH